MRYEVQTWTLGDGWINCWSHMDSQGDTTPVRFKTYKEALKELNSYLTSQSAAVACGDMAEEYSIHDFRIKELE